MSWFKDCSHRHLTRGPFADTGGEELVAPKRQRRGHPWPCLPHSGPIYYTKGFSAMTEHTGAPIVTY